MSALWRLVRAHPFKAGLTGLVAALVIVIGVQQFRLDAAQDARVDAELARDSIEAVNDTTEEVLTAAEDSVRYWERRALQQEQRADSIDEALDVETKARAELAIVLDSARAEDEAATGSTTVDSADVRTASFEPDVAPFSLEATVHVPPAPDTARGDFQVGLLRPVPIGYKVTCGDPAEGSEVNRAHVLLRTPDWAPSEITSAQQDPRICNPALYDQPHGLLGLDIPVAPLTGGITGAAAGFAADRSAEGALIGALSGAATGWLLDELF